MVEAEEVGEEEAEEEEEGDDDSDNACSVVVGAQIDSLCSDMLPRVHFKISISITNSSLLIHLVNNVIVLFFFIV